MKTLNFLLIAFFCSFACHSLESPPRDLKGYYDGPYVFIRENKVTVLRVSPGQQGPVYESKTLEGAPGQMTLKVFPDGEKAEGVRFEPFEVSLFDYSEEKQWQFRQPEKIFAISDIECSFANAVTILQAGGVIGQDYEWIFGQNHLVVNGDMFSRGLDMMALLWLLYKLDYEALQAGGKVHVTIGNHEAMNLKGDVRYVMERYLEFSEEVGISYKDLFGADTELGAWLRSKNTIVKIGRNLFVHAGISPQYLEWALDPQEVNDVVRQNLGKQTDELDEKARFVFGSTGPHWYRGMVFTEERYNPVWASDLPPILEFFDVDRVVVGHSKGETVFLLRDQQVVVIDVNHSRNFREGIARGLLIENLEGQEVLYKINDNGERLTITEKD